jgi:hypothetical protein
MRRANLLITLSMLLGATMVFGPSSSSASVSCSFSGTPANQLTLNSYRDPLIDLDFADGAIRRKGSQLRVHSGTGATACPNPVGTLGSLEAISFSQHDLSFATLQLAGGPLAPGGSPEPDGTNEIEVQFVAEANSLAYGIVEDPRKKRDRWVFGQQSGVLGASLSPARSAEFDVTYTGPGDRFSSASGGPGNDVFTAQGNASLGPFISAVIFEGGPGNDRLTGGPAQFDNLIGGPGRDRIQARDGMLDAVECGPGKDRARVDSIDKVNACEHVTRG